MKKPTITPADSPGWTPVTLLHEVFAVIRDRKNDFQEYGPWSLVFGKAWEYPLHADYNPSVWQDWSLRDRLLSIPEVDHVEVVPFDIRSENTWAMFLLASFAKMEKKLLEDFYAFASSPPEFPKA